MGYDNPRPQNLEEGLKLLDKYTPEDFSSRRPIHNQYKIGVDLVNFRNNHNDKHSSAEKKGSSMGKYH